MTTCTIPGCTAPVLAKGLCTKHYNRVRRTGDAATVKPAGRKPKPGGEADRHAALRAENARLRAEKVGIDKELMEKWIVENDLDKPEKIEERLRLVRESSDEINPRSQFHKTAAAFAFIS